MDNPAVGFNLLGEKRLLKISALI